MDQVGDELKRIQLMTDSLNQKLLSESNLQNLNATFANLKVVTENLKSTSENLNGVIKKAGETVDQAGGVMKTANDAANDLKGAIGDVRKTAETATKTVDAAHGLVRKVSEGEGTLGVLVNDKKMGEDLKALVANLRRSGVLFYKDRPVAQQPAAHGTDAAKPASESPQNRLAPH